MCTGNMTGNIRGRKIYNIVPEIHIAIGDTIIVPLFVMYLQSTIQNDARELLGKMGWMGV
jgi:hypothetical protein